MSSLFDHALSATGTERNLAASALDAAQYDAWYQTHRGSWIGDTEYELLRAVLAPHTGESIVDIGCGTGYFTRRFARDGHAVTGVDIDSHMVDFARGHAAGAETYRCADALHLPFPDRAFDLAISVTALCFIGDERAALSEMLRVSRRRFALGLLNRHSLLYLQKGRTDQGAYRGAHWHTAGELESLMHEVGVEDHVLRFAIFIPGGGGVARLVERHVPTGTPLGAFIAAGGNAPAKPPSRKGTPVMNDLMRLRQ